MNTTSSELPPLPVSSPPPSPTWTQSWRLRRQVAAGLERGGSEGLESALRAYDLGLPMLAVFNVAGLRSTKILNRVPFLLAAIAHKRDDWLEEAWSRGHRFGRGDANPLIHAIGAQHSELARIILSLEPLWAFSKHPFASAMPAAQLPGSDSMAALVAGKGDQRMREMFIHSLLSHAGTSFDHLARDSIGFGAARAKSKFESTLAPEDGNAVAHWIDAIDLFEAKGRQAHDAAESDRRAAPASAPGLLPSSPTAPQEAERPLDPLAAPRSSDSAALQEFMELMLRKMDHLTREVERIQAAQAADKQERESGFLATLTRRRAAPPLPSESRAQATAPNNARAR